MGVVIGIVAHITRQSMADQLAEQVSADFISLDEGTLGPNKNHRRTWTELATLGATHAVVLEDDCVPVHDLRHQLEQAIKAAPSDIISGYLGKQRPPQWMPKVKRAIETANQNDAHYITSTHLLHGVCIAMHTDHIPPMLAFTATRNYLPWDEAVGAYARHTKQLIAYTWPSLVDHRDGPTLIAHRDGSPRRAGRVAWHIGTRHTWNGTQTVTM